MNDQLWSNEMRIRRLGIKDYDAMFDLWRRSGLTSLRPTGRDSHDAIARQLRPDASSHENPGFQTALGLQQDDQLIGMVIVTHDGRKGWINRLAVDPDHRRRGQAQQLLAAAEALLSAQDIRVIGALVERENDASLALFRQAGYHLHDDICYLSKRDNANV